MKTINIWILGILAFFIILYVNSFNYEAIDIPNEVLEQREVKDILERKGYQYLDSFYINYDGRDNAHLIMEARGGNTRKQVFEGIQTLQRVYENATTYYIQIDGDRKSCTYGIDGMIFRDFYENGWSIVANLWFESSINENYMEECRI